MHFHLLVGTTSGNTDYLAEQLAEQLQSAGHSTTVHDEPDLNAVPYTADANGAAVWLACIATHGAGEYAESFLGFIHQIKTDKPDLSAVQAAIVAVGDSSYDTFCQAGKDCESLLQSLGARLIYPSLEIDMFQDLDPEQSAINWLNEWLPEFSG